MWVKLSNQEEKKGKKFARESERGEMWNVSHVYESESEGKRERKRKKEWEKEKSCTMNN